MKHPALALALTLCLALFTGACDNDDNDRKPLLQRYELSSTDSVPEGVAFDPKKRHFYASSLQGGGITRVDASGRETFFRAPDFRATIGGIKVDAAARRLWACASNVDDIDARVWLFDLRNGELLEEFFLGALFANASCNDLALDADGFAYVTDPQNTALYKLDPNSGEGEVFANDPLLADMLNVGLGQNGIVVNAAGDALIVAKFVPAGLVRVSLPDAGSISAIALTGDPLPTPDGIVELGGDIYSVADSSVARTRLNADSTAGEVVVAQQPESGLSTATVAEGQVYVVKSEVTNFVVGLPLNLPFSIFSIDLAAFDR